MNKEAVYVSIPEVTFVKKILLKRLLQPLYTFPIKLSSDIKKLSFNTNCASIFNLACSQISLTFEEVPVAISAAGGATR